MKVFKAVLGLLLGTIHWGTLQAAPTFLGPGIEPVGHELRLRSIVYMTAEQMASRVQSLTGFYQSGFAEFARILGTFDARTGIRTSDRPTVLSVLILERLLSEVATSVVTREIFLDASDRIVFGAMDLNQMPNLEQLSNLTQRLCQQAFVLACPKDMEDELTKTFTSAAHTDLVQAWSAYLSLFLQNGAMFYL